MVLFLTIYFSIFFTSNGNLSVTYPKKFLKARSVDFEVVDMSTPEALTELRFNQIFTVTVPVLQINDTFLTHEDVYGM